MATTWEVTDQLANQYGPASAGTPQLGVEVFFITGLGNRSSVWVANDHYNVTEVRNAIIAKAVIVDGVGTLKHTG
jgi:hypothetical protein